MKFLPKDIHWYDPYSLSPNSYREVLIATHKHSSRDWTIYLGYIDPINDYKDYRLMGRLFGMTNSHSAEEFPKDEVIAVGMFKDYGDIE